MDRKILWALVFYAVVLSGCETTKGVGKTAAGAAAGVASTIEGAGKDTYSLWKFVQAVDNWIKENVW